MTKIYVPDTSLPRAAIFDIDGTLAHKGDRKPYDWARVGEDTVDEHLALILSAYARNSCYIILVSGRDNICRPETAQWLFNNDIYYDCLFMRQEKDYRSDTIVKDEIFWRDIAPKYNVRVVFDDRPSVVRMWHDLGIPKVIAVADQRLEF